MTQTVYDIFQNRLTRPRPSLRDARQFIHDNFYHIFKMDLKSAQADAAECIALWEKSLDDLRQIAAGKADISTKPIILQNWRYWMSRNLRDIAPDDYVAWYEIPRAEAMLGRLEELRSILGYLAGENPMPRHKKTA